MGTGSLPGVKRPGRGVDHPLPTSAEVKEGVEINLCSPSGPSWPVQRRTLPLPLPGDWNSGFSKKLVSYKPNCTSGLQTWRLVIVNLGLLNEWGQSS